MIEKNNFKDLITYALIIGVFVLAFFVIKPVIIAIIYGVLLAYITHPVYKLLTKKIKNKTVSAFIVCLGFFIVIIAILALIIGALFGQAVDFFISIKTTDFASQIANAIPKSIIPASISESLINNIRSSVSNLMIGFLGKFNNFITDLPLLFLKFAVTIFVFFFALRDGETAMEYLKSVSPLKKETGERFLKRFKDVTNSVLLGQILVGIIQGSVAGIGFFIFGVHNALLLTLISIALSIIPMIGPAFVWVPVLIFMLISGRTEAAFIFLIYNLFLTSLIDNLLRPLIVSKRAQINSAIVLVGMVGGFLVFGIIGFIIGPLVLAYVILVIEIYRKREYEPKTEVEEKK
jgi:predicted PurR-regulated permease PerM